MSGLSRTLVRTTAAAVVALTLIAPAEGAAILLDNSNAQDIPALTGFVTTGANMAGMSVTARFKNGFSETLSWGATGLTSGGVTGDNWGLSLAGDSSLSSWSFILGKDAAKLTGLTLDGSTGSTVFDKREPDLGPAGSFSGLDFRSSLNGDSNVRAIYRNPVGINGVGPVGDLFQILDLDFSELQTNGVNLSFSFMQDTDNDSRIVPADVASQLDVVPVYEPGTLVLLGLGLAGVARHVRRIRA